jgi:hypothetical protein
MSLDPKGDMETLILPGPCRCEVRALEALLAEWRPVVRAAVLWEIGNDSVNSTELAARIRLLSDAAREAAR